MRKWNITMVIAGSLLLVLMLAATASAQRPRPQAPGIQTVLQNLGIRQFIQGLQLTEPQRESIRSILREQRNEILESRKLLLEARLALLKNDLAGPDKFGAAQARITALRQDIMNQIKKGLTPEQLSILEKREQRQAARIEELLTRIGKN